MKSRDDFVEYALSGNWSFFLYAATANNLHVAEFYVGDQLFTRSRAISIEHEGRVTSLIEPGKKDLFEFILGFEYPVWIALVLTMFFIPLAHGIINKSFSNFTKDFWEYFYVISSEAMPAIPKTQMKRFILALWLLSCTVFLAGYAGVIREFFIKNIPDDVIKTWDHIYGRKDLKIITYESSVLHNFIESEAETNEMAKDFKSRMEIIEFG